jgi:hypothetical protein
MTSKLEPWQWPEKHWRGLVNQVRAGKTYRWQWHHSIGYTTHAKSISYSNQPCANLPNANNACAVQLRPTNYDYRLSYARLAAVAQLIGMLSPGASW